MNAIEHKAGLNIDEMVGVAASILSSVRSTSVELSSARSVLIEAKRVSYGIATEADVRAHFERLARACLGQHAAGMG